jgi:hypothetical protein
MSIDGTDSAPGQFCVPSAPAAVVAHDHALLNHAAARLQKDWSNLQIAKDQLKKDESGRPTPAR